VYVRARIKSQNPVPLKDTPVAKRLIDELLKRAELFTLLQLSECTEVIDYDLIGEPEIVSSRVPLRAAAGEAAVADYVTVSGVGYVNPCRGRLQVTVMRLRCRSLVANGA